jgi:glycosyltransferase involved in cell wall biosynthesis
MLRSLYLFSIIVPYYNGHETIEKLLETIPSDIKVVLVDDLSTTHLPDLSKFQNLTILRIEEKGYFTGAVNYGIRNTEGDVLVLNQDTYFTNVAWIEQIRKLLDEGYSFFGERIVGNNPKYPKSYVHGTFMYISREVVNKIGLLDAKLFPMWGSTADYQTKAARARFKVFPIEEVEGFVHLRPKKEGFGKSFKELLQSESKRKSEFTLTPPLVSVVIPCYNFSKYLKDAVHSLVGGETSLGHFEQQTFSAFEVVIVDDSSTDNTPQIISELVDDYKNVRSIRLNRRSVVERGKYIGKPSALNEGIKSAWGKYIVVLDADDMMRTDRLERLFYTQIENPHSIVYDELQFFSGNKIISVSIPEHSYRYNPEKRNIEFVQNPNAGEKTKYPKTQDYDFDVLVYKNTIHNSIMFPKSAWNEIGGYPTRFRLGREDWAVNVRFGEYGYCGVKVKDYHGLLYRRHDNNRTLSNTKEEWMRFFQDQMKQEFAKLYRGDRPMACCGRGAKTSVVREDGMRTTIINVAPEGSTLLLYNGHRTVSFHVYGFITKLAYRVTPGVPFAADNRDLISDNPQKHPGLLDLMNEDNKTYKFVIYNQEPIEEEQFVEQVELEPEPVLMSFAMVEEEAEQLEVDEPDYSVLEGTVLLLETALKENDYTQEELNLLLAYEVSHKNRVSAKNLIEGELETL